MKDKNIDDRFVNHSCKWCEKANKVKICENRRSLGNHIARSHKFDGDIQKYITEFFYGGQTPACACGCNGKTTWFTTNYAYRTYISGHNKAGYRAEDYVENISVTQKRTDAIKNTYKENGQEIKGKISKSLVEAFSTPEAKEKLSKARIKTWSDPVYKKMMTQKRKDVWIKNYDEMYAKIVTPEMRKRVSDQNMKREMKKTSNEETRFVDRLKLVFGKENVKHGHWVSDEKCNKHFDAYFPDYSLLIEWDGTFWHGLREEDNENTLSEIQKHNIENDTVKNDICLKNGYRLLRIAGNTNIDKINSIETLIDNAYLKIPSNLSVDDLPSKNIICKNSFSDEIQKFADDNNIQMTSFNISPQIDSWELSLDEKKIIVGCFNLKHANLTTISKKEMIQFGINIVKNNVILFYSDEWILKNDICMSMIKHRLGLTKTKIAARKCTAKRINQMTARDFLNKNHISGHVNAKICFGLFFEENLASVLTFRMPRNKKYEEYIEICRFASALDTSVIGGLGKLLSFAKDEMNYSNIMTYADRRFGTGEGYKQVGMQLNSVSNVSYYYTDHFCRFDRFRYKAADNKKESEIAKENNVFQVPGAGNLCFTMKRNLEKLLIEDDEKYSIICKECSLPVANSNNVLARHVRSIHNIEWVDYHVKHDYSGVHPTCKTCGEKAMLMKGGFSKYCINHGKKKKKNI